MKAVVYSINPFEKEFLAKANQKKHHITLIANPLDLECTMYAKGKEAVIAFTDDAIPEQVINRLAALGVKHLATCVTSVRNTDKEGTNKSNNKIADSIAYPSGIAEIARQIIKNLDQWQQGKFAGKHATIHIIPMNNNFSN